MTAVITGASRGIGRAAAVEFARRGVPLTLLGRPSSALDETLRLVGDFGVPVDCIGCDLIRSLDIQEAASRIVASGAPKIVVHNAGVVHRTSVEATSEASWDEQLATNLRAPFLLTRALLPAMRRARAGRFLFVGSITSSIGAKNAAAYAASKWGLVGFMKSLAEEISDTGLMALALLPGSVDTDMLVGSGFSPRMTALDVARSLVFYGLDAPLAHNGAAVEMFGT